MKKVAKQLSKLDDSDINELFFYVAEYKKRDVATCGRPRQDKATKYKTPLKMVEAFDIISEMSDKYKLPSSVEASEILFKKHIAELIKKQCQEDGCTTLALKNGLCYKHGGRYVSKQCKYDGCVSLARKDGLCKKHKKLCQEGGCVTPAEKDGFCWKHGGYCVRKLCQEGGCVTPAEKDGLCREHWAIKFKNL